MQEALTPRSEELARARRLLGDRCRPTVLPDEVAWPDPGVGVLRARQALRELLQRFGLPADRARVDEDDEGERWTSERVALREGFDARPFVLWEVALYVAKLVGEDCDEELMVICVALGMGPLIGGAVRTDDAWHGFVGEAPLTDVELGALIAEQLRHERATGDRFVALLSHLRPEVRRGFEHAHALLEGAEPIDGVPHPLRRRWLEERLDEVERALEAVPRWLTPTADDFPDPFRKDVASVRRIAARLLRHAGLGDRKVVMDVFDDRPEALAWFASIDDVSVHFGVRRDIVGDGQFLVSSLAHEVAHAFRRAHRLEVEDLDLEEELTDLTSVALGFGLLLANTTERVTEMHAGSRGWTSRAEVGYLEVEDFAWLLALASRRRNATAQEGRAARAHLEARPRDAFVAALRTLDGKPPESPWTFLSLLGVATLLAVVVLALGAWATTEPRGASCRDDRECRWMLGHSCVLGRCTVPCARDRDCGRDAHCGRSGHRHVCVPGSR